MGSFPSTHWFLIERAGSFDPGSRRQATGSLLNLYWTPMYVHLRRHRGLSHHRAEELVQGFIAEVVLKGGWLSKATRERGRFRDWLRRCLDNYVNDTFRREASQRRSPDEPVMQLSPSEEPEEGASEDLFERSWGLDVLAELLRRLRIDCLDKDRPERWELFRLRVLEPALEGIPAPSWDALANRIGYRTASHARNEMVAVQRQSSAQLRAMLHEYIVPSVDLGERFLEFQELCRADAPEASSKETESEARRQLELWVNSLVDEEVMRLKRVLGNGAEPNRIRQGRDKSGTNRPAPEQLRELIRKRLADTSALRRRSTDIADVVLCASEEDRAATGELVESLSVIPTLSTAPSQDLDSTLTQILDNPLPAPAADIALTCGGERIYSLSDLLEHARPPLQVLQATKDWARRCRGESEGGWPAAVATAVYYGCIAASLVNCDKCITRLDGPTLSRGFAWAMDQSWMDERLRTLFQKAIRLLAT